jgi:alanyl-tRNA synthetase
MLGIQDKLYDIMNMQIDLWSKDFPRLKEMQSEIVEMLKVEEEKFEDTITRGEGMVKRISAELKAKGKKEIPVETLTELYDSHGLPPEIVKQAAEKESLKVEVPDDFYALIAQKHMQLSKPVEEEEAKHERRLEKTVENVPATKMLYYEDQYMREFKAKVLKLVGDDYVVLDQTCFFPEGGGQPADTGCLEIDHAKIEVVDVQKIGRVIIHRVKNAKALKVGNTVKGEIDWDKRYSLMKNHTATHVIGGAARRVLGMHVWQYGTQKGTESSRLDISHYRRLTLEEIRKIETLANEAILRNIQVETAWLPRNEAESRYGFRLYQGGAIPGKEIRVVKAGDWDVEACAGTHLKSTGEIGFIKVTHSERVQDGVERLTYSIGIPAVKAVQRNEQLLFKLAETLNAPLEKLDKTVERLAKDLKEANVERRKLVKELAERESAGLGQKTAEEIEEINDVRLVRRDFKEEIDVDRMIQTANEVVKRDELAVALFFGSDGKNVRILVLAGKTAVQKGVNAGEMVQQASAIVSGGGGGKPSFAQGGGTRVDKLADAVKKAEETLRRQTERLG